MRAAAALFLLVIATSAQAQRPQTAIVPDTITVGDVFHAAIRLELPAGTQINAPDSLALGADLETAGRREVRTDTLADRVTILYPVTAWRPGSYELGQVTLQLVRDGAVSALVVPLPSFTVQSVLPADTARVEPKPARDVLGANRLWWPILLALLVALLIAIGLYIWWRRRRGAVEEVVSTPAVPAHERARAQLAALAREGYLERGDFRPYYERLTAILRHYAEAIEPRWSTDLTTSEIAARMRGSADVLDALDFVRILGAGDLVKFARATTTRDSAARDLEAARAWVDRTAPAPADPDQRRAA